MHLTFCIAEHELASGVNSASCKDFREPSRQRECMIEPIFGIVKRDLAMDKINVVPSERRIPILSRLTCPPERPSV